MKTPTKFFCNSVFIGLIFPAFFACSNDFKASSTPNIKSKNAVGAPSPAISATPSTPSPSIMASTILMVRPDAKQNIRIGDLAHYKAYVGQSDGLSSQVDVTEKVTWKIISGKEFLTSQGIANQSYSVKGVSAGSFKIAASLAIGGSAILESNIVDGEVSADAITNQFCSYGPWSDGPCSKVCGGGTMKSTRPVISQPPALLCDETSKTASCNTDICPTSVSLVQCSISLDKSEVELGKSVVATIDQTPKDPSSIFEIKFGDQSFATNSATFSPITSGQVTATVTNAAGSATCTPASIVVKQPAALPLATCNLVADKARLPNGGGSVVISVQRTNVAPIDHFYIESIEGQTRTLNITQTTTINGSVQNAAGSSNCSPVTIDVLPLPPPAPTCTLSASTKSLPVGGGDVQVSVQLTGSAEKIVLDGIERASATIKVTASRTIEATVENKSGSNKCSVSIDVATATIVTATPTYCAHGPGGRVMMITTDEASANKCRDEANSSSFASPGGIDCNGDSSNVLSVSQCDSLSGHAPWKHVSVKNAGKCVRFNPLKCYQNAEVYWLK